MAKPYLHIFYFITTALFASQAAFAQDSVRLTSLIDTGYIEKLESQINIKVSLLTTSETLVAEGDGFRQVVKPNPSEIFRAYVNYKIISFYVDYIPHFLPGNNDNNEKGKSSGIGFGADLNTSSWLTSLSYTKTNGFYLSNTKDLRPEWRPGDPYFQIPDLHVTSYDASLGYNTNPHLSIAATESQTERQLKSAGAFIPKVSMRYYIIDNKTPNASSTQRSSHLQGLLGAGYHYTLVMNRSLYLMGEFTPSFGYIFSKLLTRQNDERYVDHSKGPVFQWDGKAGFGYNGTRIFAGAYVTGISSKFSQGLTTAVSQDTNLFFQVFVGLRLQAPKFISSTYDKILGR